MLSKRIQTQKIACGKISFRRNSRRDGDQKSGCLGGGGGHRRYRLTAKSPDRTLRDNGNVLDLEWGSGYVGLYICQM